MLGKSGRYGRISLFVMVTRKIGHCACTSGHLTNANQSEIQGAYLVSVMATRIYCLIWGNYCLDTRLAILGSGFGSAILLTGKKCAE